MKLSWIFIILLLLFVAVFSVQNAEVMTVHFMSWQIQMSAALVIQVAALLGALVGLVCGAWSKRTPKPVEKPIEKRSIELPAEKPIERPVEKPVLPALQTRNANPVTPVAPVSLSPSPKVEAKRDMT